MSRGRPIDRDVALDRVKKDRWKVLILEKRKVKMRYREIRQNGILGQGGEYIYLRPDFGGVGSHTYPPRTSCPLV